MLKLLRKTVFAGFLLCLGAAAFADTVVLKSGAKLEGKVTRRRDGVRVETANGTYTFSLAKVKAVNGSVPSRPVRRVRRPKREKTTVVRRESKKRRRRTVLRQVPAGGVTVSEVRRPRAKYRAIGRMSGPVREVKRIYVVPSLVTGGGGHVSFGTTRHYVKGWETRGDRDEPVIGTIRGGTSLGSRRGGGLNFAHRGRPRFRSFSWETREGRRTIMLPEQESISIGTRP